jgi:hypothetical protein
VINIRMVSTGEQTCPVVVCEQCGGLIQGREQTEDRGIVLYDPPIATGAYGIVKAELFAVHKGECDRKFSKRTDHRLWWRELDDVLNQLRFNTEHRFDEDVPGIGVAL